MAHKEKSGSNEPDYRDEIIKSKDETIKSKDETIEGLKKVAERLEQDLNISLNKIQSLVESNESLLMTLKRAAFRILLNQENGVLRKLTQKETTQLHSIAETLDNETRAHLNQIRGKGSLSHNGGSSNKH